MVPFLGTNLEFEQSLTRLDQSLRVSTQSPKTGRRSYYTEQNDFKILKIAYTVLYTKIKFLEISDFFGLKPPCLCNFPEISGLSTFACES